VTIFIKIIIELDKFTCLLFIIGIDDCGGNHFQLLEKL
jgi:hypothetical protein